MRSVLGAVLGGQEASGVGLSSAIALGHSVSFISLAMEDRRAQAKRHLQRVQPSAGRGATRAWHRAAAPI